MKKHYDNIRREGHLSEMTGSKRQNQLQKYIDDEYDEKNQKFINIIGEEPSKESSPLTEKETTLKDYNLNLEMKSLKTIIDDRESSGQIGALGAESMLEKID